MNKKILLIVSVLGLINFCDAAKAKYYINNAGSRDVLVIFDKGKLSEYTYRIKGGKKAEPIPFITVGTIDVSDTDCNTLFVKKFDSVNIRRDKLIFIGNRSIEFDVTTIKDEDKSRFANEWPKKGDPDWGSRVKNPCKTK